MQEYRCVVGEPGESVDWRRSSFCTASSCVEVAAVGDRLSFRQGRDPSGEVILSYTAAEVSAFFAAVKAGEFDDLIEELAPNQCE
jgi:hypothetical protein